MVLWIFCVLYEIRQVLMLILVLFVRIGGVAARKAQTIPQLGFPVLSQTKFGVNQRKIVSLPPKLDHAALNPSKTLYR